MLRDSCAPHPFEVVPSVALDKGVVGSPFVAVILLQPEDATKILRTAAARVEKQAHLAYAIGSTGCTVASVDGAELSFTELFGLVDENIEELWAVELPINFLAVLC